MTTVAFQGERGANSEDAVVKFFGEVDLLPSRTLADVFEAVNGGQADFGLIPIENSLAGSINESYDLLLANQLAIVGEVNLRVNHCLQALPGQSLAEIKQVYSHPQALAQCEVFLRNLGAEIIAVYDTAGSAKMLAEKGTRGAAAIASRRAAQIYGLEVLAEGIQTNPQNFTRFYAIGKEPAPRSEPSKTTMVFGTLNIPGALYQALGVFARRGINMVRLESRPSKARPWDYVFYADLDGHVDDPEFKAVLEDLGNKSTFFRVLGSYPAARE